MFARLNRLRTSKKIKAKEVFQGGESRNREEINQITGTPIRDVTSPILTNSASV